MTKQRSPFIQLLAAITCLLWFAFATAEPTSAGILRDLGHAGKKIGWGTVCYVKDIGRDTVKWIF